MHRKCQADAQQNNRSLGVKFENYKGANRVSYLVNALQIYLCLELYLKVELKMILTL